MTAATKSIPRSPDESARESVPRTLLIAVAVALFCSAMVSTAVYVLRPIQSAYELLERNRAIVMVAGTFDAALSDAEVVEAYLDLDARVLDLDSGRYVSAFNAHGFDHWRETPEDEAAGEGQSRLVPVYFTGQQGDRAYLVVPVHGRGMWSTIYGYVALAEDLNTVVAVRFHRHGETPGIGDRIQDPAWPALWRGKQIYDASGMPQIRVGRTDAADGLHQVDLITGASVTSEAIGHFVNEWFGEAGYGPWLAKLRQPTDGRD